MALVQTAQSGLGNLNLQDGNNYLNTLANKFIVKPKTASGIGGFVFDYEGETTVQSQAEITDHYLESNDPVQDHIAIKPFRLTLRGYTGELAQKSPGGVVGALSIIQNKLTAVEAYAGKYTPGALLAIQRAVTTAQNTVNQINLGLAKIQNIVGFLPGAAPQKSKQQKAFAQLVALQTSRQVFTVETPYRYFDSMVIESLTFIQPEDTKDWSDISITLKQMRFVQVQTVSTSNDTFGGRAAYQRQDPVSQGKTQGAAVPTSLLFKAFTGGL